MTPWQVTFFTLGLHVGASGQVVQIQPYMDQSYCLDLPGEDTSLGTKLWMWDCNGHESQNWFVDASAGVIRYAGDTGKCVDVTGGSMAEGTELQLWDCNGLSNQNFEYDYNALTLYLPGGFCMDVPGEQVYHGVKMWIWQCSGGENQKFILAGDTPSPPAPPFPSGPNTIQPATQPGYCLDLPGEDTSLGTKLWMWDCNGHASQNWIVDASAGVIRYAGDTGKCVDVTGGSIEKGTELQLWDCNGLSNQNIEYYSATQTFWLPTASQDPFCMDHRTPVNMGDWMSIWECNGMPSQLFTMSQGPSPSPSPAPTPRCAGPLLSSHGSLETHPAPSSSFPSGPFTVSVGQGPSAQKSFVYLSVAPNDAPSPQQGRTVSWTSFSFTGSVIVKVTPQIHWQAAVIRPWSRGISVCRDGDAAVFTMTQPGQVNVEFDGNTQDSLMIFGDGPEDEEDKTADIVFGPGEHDIGYYEVNAGKSIRLEGGAWVRGQFMSGGNNVRIVGRGVLSGENIPHPSEADDSKGMVGLCGDDIIIRGITIVNPPTYQVNINPYWTDCWGTRTLVENVKTMGWHWTTDGIMVGRDSTVRGNFVRANDDSLKVYMSNTVWEKNTIWQGDNGQPFMLSWNTPTDESNIIVRDCTVIQVEHQCDYGDSPPARPAVFGSVHGGAGQLSQFHFENIIVEGPVFRPFGFSQAKNPWGGSGSGTISDVTLHGVSFTSAAPSFSVINGHISEVAFRGLTYEGQLISSASQGRFAISDGAFDVSFSSAFSADFELI